MRGDFSRDTFNRARNYSSVLMQQGRVQLDADWNEQAAIVLHHLRALAADIFGRFGGPINPGFRVRPPFTNTPIGSLDFEFNPGRYYVDGIMCEAEAAPPRATLLYSQQPYFPWRRSPNIEASEFALRDEPFLVYLDVWDRFVSAVEDPSLREVALNGPDTAGRSQVVWQVKAVAIDTRAGRGKETCRDIEGSAVWQGLSPLRTPAGRLRVNATGQGPAAESDPCAIPPDARYRGAENQLYRVEIHRGGRAGTATFKWSRDNGSVVFPVVSIAGRRVTVEHLGRDERLGLHPGDWVEVLNDDYTLLNHGGVARLRSGRYELLPQDLPLLRVEDVDPSDMTVVLSGPTKITAERNDPRRPFLRRWDHGAADPRAGNLTLNDGAIVINEGVTHQNWLTLEDGIQIQFKFETAGTTYRAGDYWLIPARVATGNVEWPRDGDGPLALPPRGIEHHFAPLAIYNGGASPTPLIDLLRTLAPAACPA